MSDYSSKSIGIKRPPNLISIIQIAFALIASLILFIYFISNTQNITSIFFLLIDLEDEYFLLFSGSWFLFFILIVIKLIRFLLPLLIRSFNHLIMPWYSTRIPKDYKDYTEVANGLREKKLSIFKPLGNFITSIFGKKSAFLSPMRRKIVEEYGKGLKKEISTFIFLIIIIILLQISKRQISEIVGFTSSSLQENILSPLMVFGFVIMILGFFLIISMYILMPSHEPSTESHKSEESYRGFGHPDIFFSRISELSKELQFEGFENRIHTNWEESKSLSIDDVGLFNGFAFIERQPEPITKNNDLLPGIVPFTFGIFSIFLGIILFTSRFLSLRNFYPDILLNPIFIFLWGLIILKLIGVGKNLHQSGCELLCSTKHRSISILIDFVGTLSRADVKIGKAIGDSIESSNIVVRSDFTCTFYSAELNSEDENTDSLRDLLEINRTELCKTWIDYFKNSINSLRLDGVKPVSIDVSSSEVEEITRANIGISAMSSKAIEQAKLNVNEEDESPMIESVINQSSEFKECPDCAELIRLKARKCRFCGYSYKEDSDT